MDIDIQLQDVKDRLRALVKVCPEFAIEHPEVYQSFGLHKEIEQAHKLHKPAQYAPARRIEPDKE